MLSSLESKAPQELRSAILEAQTSVRASLEDVRRIAIDLRPEALDDLGLESALAVLADRFEKRAGLKVSCQVSEDLPRLSPDAELVIYRIAQESLTNVARHSESSAAEVSLRPDHDRVVLIVRDHGRGLATDQAPGSGIRGMRERAGLIGAALEIRNADPGVEVRLELPTGATS